jgi:phosphatidylserine/phosphatidylglycerophosphate/cardiolipin synthase-like enzyme
VRQTIVDAVNGAADRGVTVRIAYDKAQESEDGPILKQFRSAGGDPAPVGTEHFLLTRVELHRNVETRAITEEAIDPGSQIMHQKFMVKDGASQSAAVWTGSTNFTIDAWALQDNNILVISDCPELAAAYRTRLPSSLGHREDHRHPASATREARPLLTKRFATPSPPERAER